uniref:Uncharacterized protein n=1 Tax=Anguilla anguilla TaxID=7936 RepID=A0A0E9RBL9_ANGAN
MLCTCRLGKIIQLQLPLETVSALTIRKKSVMAMKQVLQHFSQKKIKSILQNTLSK